MKIPLSALTHSSNLNAPANRKEVWYGIKERLERETRIEKEEEKE